MRNVTKSKLHLFTLHFQRRTKKMCYKYNWLYILLRFFCVAHLLIRARFSWQLGRWCICSSIWCRVGSSVNANGSEKRDSIATSALKTETFYSPKCWHLPPGLHDVKIYENIIITDHFTSYMLRGWREATKGRFYLIYDFFQVAFICECI